jgi:hypothetical protein
MLYTIGGELNLEKSPGSKLILPWTVQFLKPTIDNNEVKELYWNVAPQGVRNGFDINRKSCTNGKITEQSTKNMLSLLYNNDRLLTKMLVQV